MAGFHNPFSAKPDWAGGLSDLASQIMQMLMLKRMGENGGQKQQMPQMPAMPPPPQPGGPGGGPGGMQGNIMMPGQGGAPTQQPIGGRPTSTQTTRLGITQVPEAGQIQRLLSMLPPEGQTILFSLIGSGQFKDKTQPQGQQPQRR